MSFEWAKEMQIDKGQIDADHKELLSIANRVLNLNRPKRDAEELKQVIRELYNYVQYHFSREEALMEKWEYPELDAHHKKHDLIIREMNHCLTSSHHMGELLNNFRTLVNDWVITHILEEDKKIRVFREAKAKSRSKKD